MCTARRQKWGFTIAELAVAGLVLGLLTAALFAIYRLGASALAKGSARSEMLADLQVITARLEKDLARSCYESLSIGPAGESIAFLSPVAEGVPQTFDPISGQPLWRSYVIYWWDAGEKVVYRRVEPLNTGDPEETNPGPIDAWGGSPLTSYLTEGHPLAADVTELRFSAAAADQPVFTQINTSRGRYGREGDETAELRSTVLLRN